MKCHDAEELIVQLVYDELTGEARDDLLKHMESCGGCREIFNDLKESSVILSDSFSDLEDLKLTDEELVEILSVTPESEIADTAAAGEDTPVKTVGKRPFYFNSTFGIAASLLVTSVVLVIIYWNKMFGSSYDMAMMESKPMASPAESYRFGSRVFNAPTGLTSESADYEIEIQEELMDDVSGEKDSVFAFRKKEDRKKSVRKESAAKSELYSGTVMRFDGNGKGDKLASSGPVSDVGEQTSPVDVSDDAPATDDNVEVVDIVTNGSMLTFSIKDHDQNGAGKKITTKPGQSTDGAVTTRGVVGGDSFNFYLGDNSEPKGSAVPAKPKAPAPTITTPAEKRQLMEGYLAKKWNVGKDREEEAERRDAGVSKKVKAKTEAESLQYWSYGNVDAVFKEKPSNEKAGKSGEDMARDLVDEGPEDKSVKEINEIEIIHRRNLNYKEASGEAVDESKLTEDAQRLVLEKQQQWKRSRDAYESILLKDPANEEAIKGLRDVYAELRESAKMRRRAQEGERMSEIEWKWIDAIPPKDVEKAMQQEETDPFANELVAKNENDGKDLTGVDNVKLPHFVDEKEELIIDVEETYKQDPIRESFFKPIPVNPFVMTSQDALSTFALDTDTAAYGIARNYINQGYLPPAGSVRTEEYVNAFDYNYSRNNANTFTVHAEAAPSPFGKGLVMLKVGVRGKVIGRDGRKASHLVFAVDTSGSMERQDRMPLLKQGLNTLLDNLDARDSISLIAYGRDSQLILDNTPMTRVDEIRKAINDLQCGGSTNLHEGIQLAYKIAKQNFRSGGVNSVILCSDGMANIGDQTAESMVNTADSYRRQGISFNSVGFGMGNYNDNILETMANKGDGSYVFIDSAKEAVSFFTEELGNRLNVIARDAKIQVKFDPRRVRRYRLLGYENRDIADKDFRNDSIDAGEVGSGQSATALYEVELLDDAEVRDLGTVFIRYQNTTTNKVEEINSRLRGDMVKERTPADSPRFFLAAAVSEFAEIMRESEYAKDGSLDAVERIANQVAVQLPLDDKVQEFRYLVSKAKGLPRAK